MAKKKIKVQGQEISMTTVNDQDYFSLTDMARKFGGRPADYTNGWLRNRDTIEYLGGWEKLHNQDFKVGEFDNFRSRAGSNR